MTEVDQFAPGVDADEPGHIVCGFRGSFQQLRLGGKPQLVLAVDPTHVFTAALLQNVQGRMLTVMTYVDDPERAKTAGMPIAHGAGRVQAMREERRWGRACAQWFDGSVGDE